ncbi:flotillin-1-like [Amphiura filiformis]|uniref:flotillin-1-like n=1 Tax=Amphiura filiformis TaxID=82378 RepID=UPI003B21D3D5
MVFFEVCGPNEVMLVSGCCYSKPHIVSGTCKFVLPGVHHVQRLSTSILTLKIDTQHVCTQQGVPISGTGVAQVKIQDRNEDMLLAACQQFLGKPEKEVEEIATEILDGHQRAIMGQMTVEEIYFNRKKFCMNVFELASSDLVNMGISMVSYTITDIRDDQGYLKALGMSRSAEVKRDATMEETDFDRDS